MQKRWKPPSASEPTRRRINMKAKIITGEDITKQLENKTKTKSKRKRQVSSESDSDDEEDCQQIMELDVTSETEANDVESPVEGHDIDSNNNPEEKLTMPVLDDNSVGKFYAVFYSTPIKSYYWGKITKTFEYDEDEQVSSVEVDFLRRKNISSDPEKLTWGEPVLKDVQIVSSEFVFFGPANADIIKGGHFKFPDKKASSAFRKYSISHTD